MKFDGTSVLITGAAGGIGSEIARHIARPGVRLILLDRIKDRCGRLATELRSSGAIVSCIAGDLAQSGEPERLVAEAHAGGPIDVLVNCAGLQNFGSFADESPGATASLIAVNTIGPIALAHAVLPQMLSRERGQIVNVGSIFGSIGYPYFATYSASKFALRGFSEALRRELVGTGVSVTYVAPRFTRTRFNSGPVTRMADALQMNQDDPAAVAAAVVKSIETDDKDRYLGWPEKLFVRLNAVLPRLVDLSLHKQVGQMRPFAVETQP
ncbi:MAG: SDR family oxidoreductase [Burkholderiaceae bacterium]